MATVAGRNNANSHELPATAGAWRPFGALPVLAAEKTQPVRMGCGLMTFDGRNMPEYYDAKSKKPLGRREGVLKLGRLESPRPLRIGGSFRRGAVSFGLVVSLALGLIMLGLTPARGRRTRS